MSPLRQQMIDAMTVRGFSPRTHKSYLFAVNDLACFYHASPDQLTIEQLQAFFLYLVKERSYSPSSCRLSLCAMRFLYHQVLQREDFTSPLVVPKGKQRIPELLTRKEVAEILSAGKNLKHRMLLFTAYGCGLRVSELVHLRLRNIDGERRQLRIEQGKGDKDRYVVLPTALLQRLREYWLVYRPRVWLFANQTRQPEQPIKADTAQRAFCQAKRNTTINKRGGIHSLRHAYATHQLEAGLPVHLLQAQLGHGCIQSTLRYIHWLPTCQQREGRVIDLIDSLGALQ